MHVSILKQLADGIKFETLPSSVVQEVLVLNIKKYSEIKREEDFTLIHTSKQSVSSLVQLMCYSMVIRNSGFEIIFK